MVKYVDILLATTKILKKNFPKYNIYIDENQKQITIPSFYVKLMPLKTEEVLSDKRMKLLNIYITYVNKTHYQEEQLDVMDELIESFDGINIKTNTVSRYLPIMSKDIVYGDSITLKLTFKYLDDRKNIKDNPSKDYEDLMRIIKMNTYDENKNLLYSDEIKDN